ncbi:MAG: sodium:solute symporter family protein, partial [bacterium]
MLLIAVYLLFLLYAVLRLFRRPTRDVSEYLVMGRRLTLPAFVATLVTSWYGGILGVGEYAWSYGVSNWLVFGVPYYLAAGAFALFLAGRARRSEVLTVPDQLERRYGRGVALVGAAVLFVMTAPAAYVLMLGVLVRYVFGWPLWIGVVLGTALSVGYVFRGGLRAVVATDIVQFFLMFLAFLVLVPTCVARYGGWTFLRESLPAGHLVWDGGRGFQAVAVWYFIALATLVEPAFYQRCYAARSEGTARAGIGLAILFWIGF